MNGRMFGAMSPGGFPAGRAGAHAEPIHQHRHNNYNGFCQSCCHPAHKCCCGRRECMKESKEILTAQVENVKMSDPRYAKGFSRIKSFFAAEQLQDLKIGAAKNEVKAEAFAGRGLYFGMADAIIGGGCCVHLSIEYMPNFETINPSANQLAIILVLVVDSEGTILAWGKYGAIHGYHIKECIITTNPGAKVEVLAINAIARVRWCEVFSC